MFNTILSDKDVVEKFKVEHSEKFKALVRMHLSFLLHMTLEESELLYDKTKHFKKWPFSSKKSKNHNNATIEGAPLTQEGICQVYQLIEFLKKEDSLKTEGIFRKTGSLERQTELKNILIQGVMLELEQSKCKYSVHDCASVLKHFLAELPEPLLTNAHFPVYCQILENCGENMQDTSKLLESLQLLLLLLPNENLALLKHLLELLFLVTTYKEHNKMGAENLAKLFTPHLLCPKKLSPEMLLRDSQNFFGIVSFMIENSEALFMPPTKLVVEFRAQYEQMKFLSSSNVNNESVNDAVSTVFTFVDKELTAKENSENPTETALAQLYAHIQGLPESSKKRKLVKQFNKENGNGTPLQVKRSGPSKTKQGFRETLKKGLTTNKLAGKKSTKKYRLEKQGGLAEQYSSRETLNSPCPTQHENERRRRLFCYNFLETNSHNSEDSPSQDEHDHSSKKLKLDINNTSCERSLTTSLPNVNNILGYHANDVNCLSYLTSSTPTCLPSSLRAYDAKAVFTPVDEQEPKSMSPITRSAQRMPKAMQETMMTPRCRKPVLLVSGTNINNLPQTNQRHLLLMDKLTEEQDTSTSSEHLNNDLFLFKESKSDGDISHVQSETKNDVQNNLTETPSAFKTTFLEYLDSRDIKPFFTPPVDSSFSSRTDDFKSADEILNLSENQLSDSLLLCLNHQMDKNDVIEKELVLKPKQFNEHGKPIVFETSF